jgi:lysophospholipase L1-like esterase
MTLLTARRQRRALPLLIVCTLAVATVLPACGSKSDGGGPGPDPVPGGPIVYTAIGASDAAGVGSSAPCVPFTACANGRGYVPVLVRSLEASGRTVTLHNLGVPGTVLSPAIQSLGAQYGRSVPGNFLEQELPFVARDSTLVTIFAGGNDANTIGAAVERGAGGSNVSAFVQQQARGWGTDYGRLVSGVRSRAPSARIVVMNLPNMALLPYMKGRSTSEKRWMQEIAVALSREANGMASHGAVIVDLMCDGRSYDPANYSGDGFHPDDSGYAYMAGELQAAVEGSPGGPASECSYMQGI